MAPRQSPPIGGLCRFYTHCPARDFRAIAQRDLRSALALRATPSACRWRACLAAFGGGVDGGDDDSCEAVDL